MWAVFEGDDTSVFLFVEGVDEVAEGVCFGEDAAFVEVAVECHGLHEIAHPLFAEIFAGELEVHGIFITENKADEVVLFLAVAAQLRDIIHLDDLSHFSVTTAGVDF